MKNSKCPYCGKMIPYPAWFFLRRKGEYFCKRCKKESNIYIKKTIWLAFIPTLMLSLAGMLYYLFVEKNKENLWIILIVLIPYLIFYLCTPLFVGLRPKKKFQDSLYDTGMVETPKADPDPTMAQSAKVVPAFVDDIVLGDEDYKPAINSDVFNSIKEERKAIAETDGGTRSFDKFENISSSAKVGDTMPVEKMSDIPKIEEEKLEAAISSTDTEEEKDTSYDLSNFE